MYPSPEMLRAARALLGLTQEAAAKLCGVSSRTLVAAESGKGTLSGLHNVMGGYMGRGVRFDGTPDYKTQTVTVVHAEAPTPPEIPND